MELTSSVVALLLLLLATTSLAAEASGSWQLLQPNIGITAMHMQLLHNDRVIIYDRTDFGRSNLSLPKGRCRHDPHELVIRDDCTAHSIEYDVPSNTFRALFVQTDVWCSSGTVMPDGSLVQAGDFNDGDLVVRVFQLVFLAVEFSACLSGFLSSRTMAASTIQIDGFRSLGVAKAMRVPGGVRC